MMSLPLATPQDGKRGLVRESEHGDANHTVAQMDPHQLADITVPASRGAHGRPCADGPATTTPRRGLSARVPLLFSQPHAASHLGASEEL
jgi:hypothetical protein